MKHIVGKIIGFHGVKGEIKVYPLVDDISIFESFTVIELAGKKYDVENVRFHKNNVLLQLKDHNSLNAVEHFTGHISADFHEELADSQFYIADLMGMTVVDQNAETIGVVSDFSNLGQQLIYVKLVDKFAAKSDLIVPFVEDYIIDVQIGTHIKIKLDEGLLELCQ